MLIEQLDQLGKVGERTGQAVDLIDDDDVDLAGPDILQQTLQGRAVGIATGEAAIVIFGPDQGPAGMGLAPDIGLRSSYWASRELKSCSSPCRSRPGYRSRSEPALSTFIELWVLMACPQAEELGPVPTGAGDGVGDLRQAPIGLAIPGKAIG